MDAFMRSSYCRSEGGGFNGDQFLHLRSAERERKGSRPEVEEDLTGGPRLAVRHKESRRVGWLGWPEAKRDGLRSPGRRGIECGRGSWADQIEPENERGF